MKFCVLVSYDENYKRLASYSVDLNIKKYCELHGYDLHIDYQDKFDNGMPPQWQKIRAAKEVLETGKYDWVFYLDTDCVIMNSDITLESFIEDDECSFILPKHNIKATDTPIDLGEFNNIISSQFFVKNDEHGMAILNDIWMADGNNKIDKFDYEGRQIRILINSQKYNKYIKIIEERRLNRFWYINNPFIIDTFKGINDNVWKEGDFIVHVAGYFLEQRVKLVSDLNYFSKLNSKK